MIPDPCTTVAFTGHRTYCGEASAALAAAIRGLHAHGFRTFLCGMAVGFDLAAAEAVLELRDSLPGLRLVAVVPFGGQEARFSNADRVRYRAAMASADDAVVLSPVYYAGCYAVRNNYLVDHASLLVAWYDGSPGRHAPYGFPRPAPGPGIREPPPAACRSRADRTDTFLTRFLLRHKRLGQIVNNI